MIGNWWNHKILQASSQISPISGSIKDQVVTFLGKEKIDLYGKVYDVDHFTLKSKDMSIPKDKRLDFDIWYDRKNLISKALHITEKPQLITSLEIGGITKFYKRVLK